MRILAALLLLCCLLQPCVAQDEVTATRATRAPLIDGKLDDACWAAAKPVTSFFVNNTDTPAQLGTEARLVWDDTTLYVGIRCAEPKPASLVTEPLPRDNDNVFRTDCVEVMLDPTASQNNYYHIGINCSGTIADRSCTQGGFIGDMRWDSTARGASFVGTDFWSTELAIPFSCLAMTPKVSPNWRINICREKRQPAELSSIAVKGAFNNAASFRTLTGLGADFSRFCYELGEPVAQKTLRDGKVELTLQVPLRNSTGKGGARLLDTWLTSPEGKVVAAETLVDPKPGEDLTLALGPLTVQEQGEYVCYVRVADPVTKQALAYRKSAMEIRYVPVSIRLIEPWYRNAIFATQKLPQVILDVAVSLDEATRRGTRLEVAITREGSPEKLATKPVAPVQETNRIVFPVAPLPEGRLQIVANLLDAAGKTLATTTTPLRKLPFRAGEVWMDKEMQWRVEGKPFFLNGAWNYPQDFLPEYNAFSGEKPGDVKILDCTLMNDLHYKATSLRDNRLNEADTKLVRDHAVTIRDNPKLFGYYMSDEPECNGTNAKALEGVYRTLAEADPYHPVIISNDSMEGLRVYANCADINGLHPYPVALKEKSMSDLSPVSTFVEESVAFFAGRSHKQTIAYLHQGFNYGDYGAVNNRIPNYLEYRSQNLLALICGARGTIQFNRMVAHYPELYLGMPALTRELQWLEPILSASAPAAAPKADSDKIKLLLREHAGQWYLLACNADLTERTVELTVPGVARRAQKLQVASEGRSVALKGDALTDRFGPYECHIYTTGSAPALATVQSIVDEIARANAARRKPGNLVYQEFEGDGVVISASSSKAGQYRRPDTGLWHVVDGVIDELDHYRCLTWQCDTDDAGPDWLEIRLPKAQSFSRVEVYAVEKSLKDYALQVWVDGQWREVAQVSGQTGDQQSHRFPAVTSDRLRLWVTATNGKNAMVTEIEVYEQ